MHPDVQKYIDLFREATEDKTMCKYCDNTGKIETDNNGPIVDCPICKGKKPGPFTVTDEELDEIQETGNIPWFLKYQAL